MASENSPEEWPGLHLRAFDRDSLYSMTVVLVTVELLRFRAGVPNEGPPHSSFFELPFFKLSIHLSFFLLAFIHISTCEGRKKTMIKKKGTLETSLGIKNMALG